MGCNCARRTLKKDPNTVKKEEAVRNNSVTNKGPSVTGLVNFEGRMIPQNSLPQGCVFISGVWYSSPEKVPADLVSKYSNFIADWKSRLGHIR